MNEATLKVNIKATSKLPALSENPILRYFSFAILYLGQGIPEGMTIFGIPAWMAMNGKTPGEIGSFVAVFGLPWSFKIVVAPLMDRFTYLPMGRRRPWVLFGQLGLMVSFIVMSMVPDPLNPWSNPPPEFARVDPALAEAMRKGAFNPFVVDVLNKAATALREPVELSETLRQLQSFARGHGSELRLVYLPFSTQVSDRYVPFQQKYATQHEVRSLRGPEFQIHQESLRRSCAKLSLPFLDLTPLLRRAEENGEHLYWDFDEHLRGATYTRVGATISRWVKTGVEPDRLE